MTLKKRHIRIHEILQKYAITNKWQFQKALPLELQAGHLDHHECPTEQVVPHKSLKLTSGNPALKYSETKISSFAPGSCHSKPTTRNSLSVPATRYSFESMSSSILMPTAMSPTTQPILKPSCSSPSGQQKYLSLLSFQGCFVPECQQDCRLWDLNHGCSATYSASYVWILAPIAYIESGAKQCKCGMLQVEMTLSQGRLHMQINSLKKVPKFL